MTPCICAVPAPQVCAQGLQEAAHPAGKLLLSPTREKQVALHLYPVLADYLVSRAQAALDTVSALEKGHSQYLTCSEGEDRWKVEWTCSFCRAPEARAARCVCVGWWFLE